jgi:hypothetical protein
MFPEAALWWERTTGCTVLHQTFDVGKRRRDLRLRQVVDTGCGQLTAYTALLWDPDHNDANSRPAKLRDEIGNR